MKLLEYHDILNGELFHRSAVLESAWDDIQQAVACTDWPHGSGAFTIYPESGKKSGQGNGVKLIASVARSGDRPNRRCLA